MIRKPAVAGAFYTDNPLDLRKEIKLYLKNAINFNLPDIKALIAPHAGYIYSGQVAAFSYKQIEGKHFDTVVIFAPSHRAMFNGVSIYQGKGYETPLGIVDINNDLVNNLISQSHLINFYKEAHLFEHSLEVQLPFLQIVLDKFNIIPVLVGSQNINELIEVGEIFNNLLDDRNVLFIASTDLSHFHSSKVANHLDSIAISDIEALDYEKFYFDIKSNNTEACGAGPVILTLHLARLNDWNNCKILKYSDSSDISGDKSNVVGYLSAAIYVVNHEN